MQCAESLANGDRPQQAQHIVEACVPSCM